MPPAARHPASAARHLAKLLHTSHHTCTVHHHHPPHHRRHHAPRTNTPQVSFHKYGDFFPGTGALGDVGTGRGNGYTVNVPLREGMDNESYRNIYEPVMTKVGRSRRLLPVLLQVLPVLLQVLLPVLLPVLLAASAAASAASAGGGWVEVWVESCAARSQPGAGAGAGLLCREGG
jgi:hypothetical protein